MKKSVWNCGGFAALLAACLLCAVRMPAFAEQSLVMEETLPGETRTEAAGAALVSGQEPAEAEVQTQPENELSAPETESPIDFEALWQENSDIYAWLNIPGTTIDYPILQSKGEEDFYLYHDIHGEEDIRGSIYTQKVNRMNFTDFHTILYGHNMRDGSMFGSLYQYQELDYLWDHGTIFVYLPDRTLEYWIFSAYVTDDTHLLAGIDQTKKEDREQYLRRILFQCSDIQTFDKRLFSKVDADSRILTLSTCYQNDPEHRFVVQAVLVE